MNYVCKKCGSVCRCQSEAFGIPVNCLHFINLSPEWEKEPESIDTRVKRPEWPEWCQEGNIIWSSTRKRYGLITKANSSGIRAGFGEDQFVVAACHINELREARLIPWTLDTAPIALKCRCKMTGKYLGVWYLNKEGDAYDVPDCCCQITFEDMKNNYLHLNCLPCGTLQHRNDESEWVTE